jgi:two-component system, NtrC family, nitrogen regulation response regulator GlnG
LAATNRDLHDAVASGAFREDLFHRLSAVQIHLPPLRQRAEDIAPLCEYFLGAMDYDISILDDSLLATLQTRPWYGNVRELRNAIGHAAVVARGRPLSIDDFPAAKPGRDPAGSRSLEQIITDWTARAITENENLETLYSDLLAAIEPSLFQVVLKHTGGNRAKAAEMLGIHRGTLRDRLRAYGIDDAT